ATVRDLEQAFVEREHRGALRTERELRGPPRARQRRGHRAVDAQVAQALAQRARLRFAFRRQRDVLAALVAAFGIPRGLAVARGQQPHNASSESTPVIPRKAISCCSGTGRSTVIAAKASPSPLAPSEKLTMLIPAAPRCEPTSPTRPGRSTFCISSRCASGSNSISTPSSRTTQIGRASCRETV